VSYEGDWANYAQLVMATLERHDKSLEKVEESMSTLKDWSVQSIHDTKVELRGEFKQCAKDLADISGDSKQELLAKIDSLTVKLEDSVKEMSAIKLKVAIISAGLGALGVVLGGELSQLLGNIMTNLVK